MSHMTTFKKELPKKPQVNLKDPTLVLIVCALKCKAGETRVLIKCCLSNQVIWKKTKIKTSRECLNTYISANKQERL